MKTVILIGIASILFILPVHAMDIVRDNPDSWTCVDHAVNHCRENPGYIPTSVSYHPFFKGRSHMVAIDILDANTVHIIDNMNNASYVVHNWQLDGQYYHFWIDGEIARNYWFLRDNREMVLY